ncbi:MAG TPA: YqgE/AlgH family protein [Burkholderiales bacterium]|nr:YqgE/AlgH family protein [Burkholderiales bacterium]
MWKVAELRRACEVLLLTLGLVLAAFGYASARAQDLSQPLMLVATPQMGGFYRHTVLIAVPVAGGRHIGFIINRPTEKSMSSLFPEHNPSRKVSDPVFLGGPEMVTSIFAVLKAGHSPGGANFPFVSGTFIVADAKTIDRIIEQSPNEARYYAGFVAWQPGELQTELDKGFWFVMPPQTDLIFKHEVTRLWEELIAGASKTST